MDKNYYKIMGLTEEASEKDIKRAYRQLARKYHPDVNKEPNAEERFKEVGEAYKVLKDPAKSAEYDKFLRAETFDPRGAEPGRSWHQQEGEPFVYGGGFNEDLFETLFGHARYQHQPRAGQDYHGTINISLEEAYHGSLKNIQIPIEQDSQVKMQTLKVKIPPGVKSNQQIRLAGQGAPGIHGGPPGDIYLTVQVAKHSLFDVMDNDIYLTLPITPWEAALGTTVVVPTLGGKIDLKIPPGSQGGQKLRLKNRGLPAKAPGNQYILLKIITPPPTTEAAKALYQKMSEEMPFNPRKQMGV